MASRKREEGESYEDYRKDLRMTEAATRTYLKGRPVWIAKFQGPYVRKGPKGQTV